MASGAQGGATAHLVAAGPDFYAFTEPHRKDPAKSRLTISCHGSRGEVEIDRSALGPEELSRRIRAWVDVDRLRSVRLVACHTADLDPDPRSAVQRLKAAEPQRWSSAFGAQLSTHLPDIRVKCFGGRVEATCRPEDIWKGYEENGPAHAEQALSRRFHVFKDDEDAHHHSVTFLDGAAIKQRHRIEDEEERDYAVLQQIEPADEIKAWRRGDLTQEKAAERLGLQVSTLRRYAGDREPDMEDRRGQ